MVEQDAEPTYEHLDSLNASPGEPITFNFESWLSATILEWLPRIRGGALLGQILFSLLPLKKGVTMDIAGKKFPLQLDYRTHIAFLMKPFEPVESSFVMSVLHKGDIFVDIGANWGYYTALAAAIVGEEGLVVAVEANPSTFIKLVSLIKNASLNNVLAFNIAVADIPGKKVTIRKPWYRTDTAGFIVEDVSSKHYVRTTCLDLLWRQLGCPKVRMVKMDIEGSEILALKGGARFLTEGVTEYVLLEVSNYTSRFGAAPSDIYHVMADYGYTFQYLITDRLIPLQSLGTRYPTGNVAFCKSPINLKERRWTSGKIRQ